MIWWQLIYGLRVTEYPLLYKRLEQMEEVELEEGHIIARRNTFFNIGHYSLNHLPSLSDDYEFMDYYVCLKCKNGEHKKIYTKRIIFIFAKYKAIKDTLSSKNRNLYC